MATYKVPQDVEAEDKLIGPFSLRQFIYLIIASMAGFIAYALSQLFWALGILPAPIILFFLVMALPLKKDQPMETYLTALVRFYLKPRRRLWEPEGNMTLVEITALQGDDGPELKDFSGQEASERLQYLSRVVDTGGWATRGLSSAIDNLRFSDTVLAEAQGAEDVFDSTGNVSQNLTSMMARSDEARKQTMLQTMQDSIQAAALPVAPVVAPTASVAPTQLRQATPAGQQTSVPDEPISFNPYPSSIHQRVIEPAGTETQSQATAVATIPTIVPTAPISPIPKAQASSKEPLPPDIMRLATSKDLSISTIAREAERLQRKHLEEEEVVVSLR